jgi:DNA-binding response OmpR family regulator
MIQALLVEDDIDLAATVSSYLELEGIECDHAYNGPSGLELALKNHYDVILLDLMLPRMDGLSVCTKIREAGTDTPVLMLTARDTLEDKLEGFNVGTDDYLVKPFALEELVVRIHALKNRRSGAVHRLQVADLILNLTTHSASRNGVELKLSPTGWKLLETLARSTPKAVSRHDLERAVWQDDPPDSNSLKVHLFKLRKKVDEPFDRALVHTVSGFGFVLRDDV